MQRDVRRLSNQDFDVLVVGGGIHGAAATWDAALRGLSVGLIERGDFGSLTSQNSLKVIHGGLRYLQDANLMRVRMMARERRNWMRIAPHLVHPLPCLTPTSSRPSRSRFVMRVALKLNDLFGYDRNRLPDKDKYLPPGRILSAGECASILPGLDMTGYTGAALWFDAQMYSSERLLLEFVLSAAQAGAVVANYMKAVGLVHRGRQVIGVRARDQITGQELDIRSKVIINATGAWLDGLPETLERSGAKPIFKPSVALNLVIRQIWDKTAVGLSSQPEQGNAGRGESQHSQMFFIVPWRDKSIIGTWHIPWPHSVDSFMVTDALIQDFINAVNSAHPGMQLSLDDIQHVHWGFLPVESVSRGGQPVELTREGQVIDHQAEDGYAGLISVLGVKYTTARAIAEKAIDLAVEKIGLQKIECRTHTTPLFGGQIERFKAYLLQAQDHGPAELGAEVIDHLVHTYGTQYGHLLDYIVERPALVNRVDRNLPVIGAEVVHAVRQEMALTLGDVVCRRTELGATGLPDLPVLKRCAELVGQELDWDEDQKKFEINSLIQSYPFAQRERIIS